MLILASLGIDLLCIYNLDPEVDDFSERWAKSYPNRIFVAIWTLPNA